MKRCITFNALQKLDKNEIAQFERATINFLSEEYGLTYKATSVILKQSESRARTLAANLKRAGLPETISFSTEADKTNQESQSA